MARKQIFDLRNRSANKSSHESIEKQFVKCKSQRKVWKHDHRLTKSDGKVDHQRDYAKTVKLPHNLYPKKPSKIAAAPGYPATQVAINSRSKRK